MKTPKEIYDMGFEAGVKFAAIINLTESAAIGVNPSLASKIAARKEKQREYQRRYLAARKIKSFMDKK